MKEDAIKKRRKLRKQRGLDPDAESDDEKEDPYNKSFDKHFWAGRCCLRLFEVSKTHLHLEKAYEHLQRSIESLTVPREGYDLSTLLRLPMVLFELGQVMEHFGAHNR